MYLIPPMNDQPPPDYVAFVALHVADLRQEADRLVGGDTEGGHLYLDALADVAGHWRWLKWWRRFGGRDAAAEYMRRRLATRAKHWRQDQIYEVDVRVLRPMLPVTLGAGAPTLALRKAAVLPGTVRSGVLAVADAGIAWVMAYRRQQWHRVGRLVAVSVLLFGAFIQYMTYLSTTAQ